MTAVNITHNDHDAVHHEAAAKWAAIVADVLIPLPRRRMKSRDILLQSQAPAGSVLIRDLNSPVDVAFPEDAEVDLGEGNVFRLGHGCETHEHGARGTPPKLAFIVNDVWKVTTDPTQTEGSLRGLFDLPCDVQVLRDRESPDDEVFSDGQEIRFADGPVFITIRGITTVKVNTKPVKFPKRSVTGLIIKETAIQQGVNIQPNFVLYKDLPGGGLGPAIANEQHVKLHECEEFTCVAPDDNS
jgi:hypothetical protein